MGLDFSHCDAHWSYGGFHNFRVKLAKEINMDLNEMYGFGGDHEWSDYKDDIIHLLNHSDCDGKLTVSKCKKVAPRLKELVSNWDDDDYDKNRALELIDGMELAISNNEPLLFT